MKRIGKIATISLLLAFFLYVGSYIANSLCGGYWPRPVSGELSYSSGLGLPTLFLWQPHFGYYDPNDQDTVGRVYAPLIYIDRLIFHKNLDLAREKDEKKLFSKSIKWHKPPPE